MSEANSDSFTLIEKAKDIAIDKNKKAPTKAIIAKNCSIIFNLICFY
jgi:hypothetical protein